MQALKPWEKHPIVSVDFDGVIHSYERGWQSGVIYGDVVPGFFEWASSVRHRFEIHVFSTRCADGDAREEMEAWLRLQWQRWLILRGNAPGKPSDFPLIVASEKPKALVSIDDRALTFTGDWNDPRFTADALANFKPWNVK